MEVLTLALVVLSPWAFGAVEPEFEFFLFAGIAALTALWGVRILLQGRFTWEKCPVALCLAGLFLLGVWQVTPLPGGLLATLSPGTARAYRELLPERPEALPGGEERAAVRPPPGSTLSLEPGGTRPELMRLLAVFLLFAVVRNNLASPQALWRLSVVALVNGTLLALLALFQFFTSPTNTVYWTYPCEGSAFGPFLCKNHFPFYVNLCVGLSVGLLLCRGRLRAADPDGAAPPSPLAEPGRTHSPRSLLHEPQLLWISIGLALMLSSVAVSLSRGGLIALLGGALVCLTLKLFVSRQFSRSGSALVAVTAALALVVWFGLDRVKGRLETLWQEKTLNDRLVLWAPVGGALKDFPVWGTGCGTFQHVEPLARTDARYAGLVSQHAHNEYAEALIEGGLVRLSLSLLAIGFVFFLGYRAVRAASPAVSGLAFGALFGFTTLVIHSAGEFGLHVPAVAVLAAVLCANLCNLGSLAQAEGTGSPDAYTFRLGGLAPLTAALMAGACALVLFREGERKDRLQRLWLAAVREREVQEPAARYRQIDLLEEALPLAPQSVYLEAALGQAHLDLFERHLEGVRKRLLFDDVFQLLTAAAPQGFLPGPGATARWVPFWLANAESRRSLFKAEEERWAAQQLVPALRHYLRARDLCPLLVTPNLKLAAYGHVLAQADPPERYLARAKRLAPGDPTVWYLCGLVEAEHRQPKQAAQSWRRSLELSERYFTQIVAAASRLLPPGAPLADVLPDRPELLLAAASRLYPNPEAPERVAIQRRALALLEAKGPALETTELYLKSQLHRALGQRTQALTGYEALLRREPVNVSWRYEFSRLLYEEGRYAEARRELLTVLAAQPRHAQAAELLKMARRKAARGQ
jgi:O-antigen ligase